MAPADEDELADMLLTAVESGGPCAIRYPRAKGGGVRLKDFPELIEIGVGRVVRNGTDLAIIALGPMVARALQASDILQASGVSAAVVNPRFIKPLDRKLILSFAERTGKLVIVEEGILAGGFGSAVLELLADEGLTGVQVARLGIPDEFVEHGTREELLSDYGLTSEGIVMAAFNLKTGSSLVNFTSSCQGLGMVSH
jgi:1-deoxy-D-xylulose-5-phosphate synthase